MRWPPAKRPSGGARRVSVEPLNVAPELVGLLLAYQLRRALAQEGARRVVG